MLLLFHSTRIMSICVSIRHPGARSFRSSSICELAWLSLLLTILPRVIIFKLIFHWHLRGFCRRGPALSRSAAAGTLQKRRLVAVHHASARGPGREAVGGDAHGRTRRAAKGSSRSAKLPSSACMPETHADPTSSGVHAHEVRFPFRPGVLAHEVGRVG